MSEPVNLIAIRYLKSNQLHNSWKDPLLSPVCRWDRIVGHEFSKRQESAIRMARLTIVSRVSSLAVS